MIIHRICINHSSTQGYNHEWAEHKSTTTRIQPKQVKREDKHICPQMYMYLDRQNKKRSQIQIPAIIKNKLGGGWIQYIYAQWLNIIKKKKNLGHILVMVRVG